MREDIQQILLILSGIIVASLFGVFVYREIFPEYKIYQNDYIALETFRSTYTQESLPPFQTGIKQIVMDREDNGPPIIDRCISCHVALQIPYFSPTKIAHDLNGNIVRDAEGLPLQIPNEDYIWLKLDEKIAGLRDKEVIAQLQGEGRQREISERLALAEKYEALKTAHVGENVYDVSKALTMHPLIGNETYPFELHPMEEYGCTSCHNGNGRGLTTDKAHGPVFDGQYEIEDLGPFPKFTESDPDNDPRFAHVFNHKPGENLVFQTDPLFVGSLIQAKCVQCHLTSQRQLAEADDSVGELAGQREEHLKILLHAYENEKQAALDLLKVNRMTQEKGYEQTIRDLSEKLSDYTLAQIELEHLHSQVNYLEEASKGQPEGAKAQSNILEALNRDLLKLIGSQLLVQALVEDYKKDGSAALDAFLKKHSKDPKASGSLFAKGRTLDSSQKLVFHAKDADEAMEQIAASKEVQASFVSTIDQLTKDYQRGMELYISQACYACHRIAGFARGGVGPDLSFAGSIYPWYLKRKLVWPQNDLPTSTMPNMRFDTVELEDLIAFLLAQKGQTDAVGKVAYKSALLAWEGGKKKEWEIAVPPAKIYAIRSSMTIFATEGCAACHRLQGFDSDVGFAVEKEPHDFEALYEQQNWFRQLFPEVVHISQYDEELPGSDIVAQIEKHRDEIDKRIASNVRQNGLLEEIDKNYPEVIESYYSPFRYASRAKNHDYQLQIEKETDPAKSAELQLEWHGWKERVHRVLMMYIQTYGLGRLIGPHLNWSGIYRSDEWLMEHFRNPSGHVPRSLMPVFPFDDTKFYALTYMLDVLAVRNRSAIREIWDHRGFDPVEAFNMLCAQCHGIDRVGNGAIAEWIYPIPKNLHNAEFLRNLTQEKAVYSIKHGVKGTPMPPWGEVAPHKPAAIEEMSHHVSVLNEPEIHYLVDWLFSTLPGGEVIREASDVPKWQYTPLDVIKELKKEGGKLLPHPEGIKKVDGQTEEKGRAPLSFLPSGEGLYAALHPKPFQVSSQKEEGENASKIFTRIPRASDSGKESYYIKKKYYTPQNIEAGQEFFLTNCAVCHGAEADGSSLRSGVMQEAKPRMLTNLDWLQSRDDLRLLRSIKYGVPGTAMTPWGDLTNSLQRLQLVIFIRSLTAQQERRDSLTTALYQTYDRSQHVIEMARIENSQEKEKLRKDKLQEEAEGIRRKSVESPEAIESALSRYKKILELEQQLSRLEKEDQKFTDLLDDLKKEKVLYFNLGAGLISKDVSSFLFTTFLEMIRLNEGRYSYKGHRLKFNQTEESIESERSLQQKIVASFNRQISELEFERGQILGKIRSAQSIQELASNQADIESTKKLRNKLIAETEEAFRLVEKQRSIVLSLFYE